MNKEAPYGYGFVQTTTTTMPQSQISWGCLLNQKVPKLENNLRVLHIMINQVKL